MLATYLAQDNEGGEDVSGSGSGSGEEETWTGSGSEDVEAEEEDIEEDEEVEEEEEEEEGGGEMDTATEDDDDDRDGQMGMGDEDGPTSRGDRSTGLLPTEDDFFRLDEMEAFVREAEEEEMRRNAMEDTGVDDDQIDSEKDDLDEDLDAGIEEDDDDEDEGMGGFDLPSGGEEDEEDARLKALLDAEYERMVGKASRRKVREEKDEEDGEDDEEDEDNEEDENPELSSKYQEMMYDDFFGHGLPRHDWAKKELEKYGGVGADGEDSDDMEMQNIEDVRGEEDRRRGRLGRGKAPPPEEELEEDHESGEGEEGPGPGSLSRHERYNLALRDRIANLEERALAERPWHLRGEVDASQRPLNSALEIDMEFDRGVKPPPEPTVELANTLEEIIKKRILENKWDDVVRVVKAVEKKRAEMIELDDEQSKRGLGEVYADDYVRGAAGGGSVDRHEPIRIAARAQYTALAAQLDALSHLFFTPTVEVSDPVVQTAGANVPAVHLEEVLPVTMTANDARAPEEVHAPRKDGVIPAEGELEQAERKKRRAKKKRIGSRLQEEKEKKRKVAMEARVEGRKSEAGERAMAKKGRSTTRGEFGKSGQVFAKLQEQQEMAKAGVQVWKRKKAGEGKGGEKEEKGRVANMRL